MSEAIPVLFVPKSKGTDIRMFMLGGGFALEPSPSQYTRATTRNKAMKKLTKSKADSRMFWTTSLVPSLMKPLSH